ncbi:MAG: hypothetical protein FWC26_11495 [Fibromonadales bacterium]|nr:hypothetical protein [Fibromonadales bacterium]
MSSEQFVIIVIGAILLLVAILAVIGVYILVHKSNREKDTEELSKIVLSGKYSVALRPVAESLEEKKPSMAEIEGWLNSQNISEEEKSKYLADWQKSINQNIKTINEGDMNGITTYRIVLGPKDKGICKFLPPDHFITRDQIKRSAEILPPYYFGSDSAVVPKPPWDTANGSNGWKAVLLVDGKYAVPDWRQIV